MSVAAERGRIAVGGVETRLLQAGAPEAEEAVVFVHGNPGSADDWGRLIGAVAEKGFRALALDLPDFGKTVAPAGFEHSVPGYAAFLTEALEALGVERAHLVLHDFGGPIGLKWATDHADALASVTLINIGLLPGYRWHWAARVWRTPMLGEILQALTSRWGFRFTMNRAEPRGLPRAYIDEMYDHFDRRTRRAVLNLYRATDEFGAAAAEFAERVDASDIPALVIWGEGDAYLPARYALRQREAFPAAGIHVLSDSGHWPFVDRADRVEELIVEFLERARSGGTASDAAGEGERANE